MRKPKAETARLMEIPLRLVDEPELAMRETFDEVKLEELTESIREVGVLQPIAVQEQNGRYRIQDGHRRFIASMRAGKESIPAVVRPVSAVSGEAVKCHANAYREDVNAAEEAGYFARLLEGHCGGDVDHLCRLVMQKRAYVEDRLLLIRGDQQVFEALRGRRVSMAVAKELNRVKDRGYRLMFLDAAAKGGASARMVQQWRIDAERVIPVEPPAPTDGTNQFSTLPAPVTSMLCFLCDSADEPHEMELLWVHRGCRKVILDRFLAQLKPPAPAAAEEGGTNA